MKAHRRASAADRRGASAPAEHPGPAALAHHQHDPSREQPARESRRRSGWAATSRARRPRSRSSRPSTSSSCARATGSRSSRRRPPSSTRSRSCARLLPPEGLRAYRSLGGLQAYPSRAKNPDWFDFSTGSMGLGAVAPAFAALMDRYLCDRFGGPASAEPGQARAAGRARNIALVGDAELDEGSVWEAWTEEAMADLAGHVVVVDLNRQSLDRVVGDHRSRQLERLFQALGWHVVSLRFGRRLAAALRRAGRRLAPRPARGHGEPRVPRAPPAPAGRGAEGARGGRAAGDRRAARGARRRRGRRAARRSGRPRSGRDRRRVRGGGRGDRPSGGDPGVDSQRAGGCPSPGTR